MRRPFGLRFVSWCLLILGVYILATSVIVANGDTISMMLRAVEIGVGVLLVVSGVGLLRVTRWGWVLGLVDAGAALAFGAYVLLTTPGDFGQIGSYVGVVITLALPAVVVLCTLLNPAAVRWFRLHGTPSELNSP